MNFFQKQNIKIVQGYIYVNFKKRDSGAKLKPLFWKAAKSSTKEEFARIMKTISKVCPTKLIHGL